MLAHRSGSAVRCNDKITPNFYFCPYLNSVQEWQEKIGAFAVFFSWMGLLLMLQNVPLIPNLGVFVVMFTDTLKTFTQFLIILVFFIVGFALSFNILIGNQVCVWLRL